MAKYRVKTVKMKSAFRVGHCCKWMYMAMVISLTILISLELSLYGQLKEKISLQKERRGRKHRGILESSNDLLRQQESKHAARSWKSESDSDIKKSKKIFRTGQRVEKTMDLVEDRVKQGKGGSIYCEGNLEVFNLDIVLMRNVLLDTRQLKSKIKGGETIQEVMGQDESAEQVTLKPGFFRIPCASIPLQKFSPRSYFSKWYLALSEREIDIPSKSTEISNFTVFIKRGDYANMYWTIIELYNTFLTIRLFGKDPKSSSVVLVDAHPLGKLENLWTLLFGNVIRIGSMHGDIFIKEAAWVIPISASPIGQAIPSLPFIRDFKMALYKAVGINVIVPMCGKGLNQTIITLILRHDYVAHPRNPSGSVKRKISNEKELIKHLDTKFPGGRLNAVQLDNFSIEEQIRIIYNTSILIGVHGAGLALTILLRPGASMFEMFPSTYKRSPNQHFQQFAVWGGSWYESWFSNDKLSPKNEWIRIPTEIPTQLIEKSLRRMCNTLT
ncbi:uncharacterized protein LOC110443248 [Mizuhopecten yessoensis]|uniref:EGF domain-specific O-linked N-acetylglucosamine transferase n=1 Tax=Mizuhopecten yessoensis TaxID=6573 RepID=A0A210PFD9_MIZYE|nr:uncharacterized protein LOC110443248 [Mizuhopecten yessoensis]XP_021343015.1 uncharacterized protein LOC110443248 [Mizuhopecten yessoensis]XP_021343016.1 uncharacterized protein LOC110443248 [Mizuhopecten yessoensis]OWF35204.1 Beta-(1,2)-xylosyltransferase [Mizuhopecten yessoensis]